MRVSPKTLYENYRGAMAHVVVRTADGDEVGGSAFHIGEGCFATAAHVVDGMASVRLFPEVGTGLEVVATHTAASGADVAVIVTAGEVEKWVPLGSHLDDWIRDEDFYLVTVLIMGYPRVPLTREPRLVAVTGEVNAVVDRFDVRHPHFIVSPLPRGGFSGAPAIVEWDFSLGVVVEDLHLEHEHGFTAVVSVEPLWQLLDDQEIRPAQQDALEDR